MIPSIDPGTIENSGEKEAYEALEKGLPGSWVVRWHYPYCVWESGRLREGEADFIVLAPGKGMLVIEVKGTEKCRIGEDGSWHREYDDRPDEKLHESPLEQAARNKHRLAREFAREVYKSEVFPGTRGHLAFYPNGRVSGKVPVSDEPAIVLQFKDKDNLEKRLTSAFRAWGSDQYGQHFSEKTMEMAVEELSRSLETVPVLAASAAEDEKIITDLTLLQFEAFRGLLGNPRVHVKGAAGSGKTLLARWTSDHLASESRRVFLTCYNNVLASWLRDLEGRDPSVEIDSFFRVCRKIVLQAGLSFNVPGDRDAARSFWESRAPELLVEALDSLSPGDFERYDCVIVDEGQDFSPDWWLPLQLLLKDPDNGRLCIFSDTDQAALYGREDSYPSDMIAYDIRENCRNTRRIASYCGKIISRDTIASRFQPEGVDPVIEEAQPSPEARAKRIKSTYAGLLEEGFQPSEIAVLSPFAKGHPECSFQFLEKLSNLDLAGTEERLPDWHAGKVAWVSTIKKFKGLEASCVILADAVLGGSEAQVVAESYVGATRAKHHLVILPRGEG